MSKTYPVGTRVGDIKQFDRSIKVEFCCTNHIQQGIWCSKDPFVSNWFPVNEQAIEFSNQTYMNPEVKWCNCPTGSYVTTSDYEGLA